MFVDKPHGFVMWLQAWFHSRWKEKRPRRCTNDRLTIYSADELGFGKAYAKGTALCPFDCDCCF